jgi:5'(3')-deoxyribonucleotidase
MPWLHDLIDVVERVDPQWYIVTSPSREPICHFQKVHWVQTWFGKRFDRISVTPHKWRYANPNAVLIDDRDSTVDTFIQRGGHGITFPALHNREHERRGSPVPYVEQRLQELMS